MASAPNGAASCSRVGSRSIPITLTPDATQHLDGDQSDQAQAKDDDLFAQFGLQQADSLQRDRPEHGERGVFVGHARRDLRAQVQRYVDEFGMVTVAGHAIAHREPGDAFANLDDRPGVAVPERQRFVELR